MDFSGALRSSRTHTLLICLAMISSVSGCQMAYRYEVRGKIRSSSTKAPLSGVLVTLKYTDGSSKQDSIETASDGSFLLSFEVGDDEFAVGRMPKWSLVLTKEGFADEILDISPTKEPSHSSGPVEIIVYGSITPAP
jgi:hypothetical protein